MSSPAPSADLYAADTNRIIADRLPIGGVALVAVFAAAWVFEHRAHPERDVYFALFYAIEALTLGLAAILSRRPGWREHSRPLAIATAVALIAEVCGYHTAVRGEGEVLNIALLYLVTGSMVLIPWDWQGQLPVACIAFVAYAMAIASGVRSATPLDINLLGLAAIGGLSVGGAAFMAQQRRALWRQTIALQGANAALADANRTKNQFIANVSHELRTPLNIIVGYTDLLLDGEFGVLSGAMQETLQRVAQNGRNLVDLVADLLDLARIEAGRVEVRPCHVELAPLFTDMTRLMEPWLNGKDVRFYAEHPVAVGVTADRDRLKQILVNLLSNAAKFTERGEIRLRARPITGGAVAIEVTDTGIGIAPIELPTIFEPFAQAAGGKKVGGVGVGLSLSAALARAMGGELSASSTAGRGSTFVLRLPAPPEAAPAPLS